MSIDSSERLLRTGVDKITATAISIVLVFGSLLVTTYIGGQRAEAAVPSDDFSWPVNGSISDTWWRGAHYADSIAFHVAVEGQRAVDITAGSAVPIFAAADGVVTKASLGGNTKCYSEDSSSNGYGNYVVVKHSSSAGTLYTLYAHLEAIQVSEGSPVSKATTQLGTMGSTGCSTGRHLHFAVGSCPTVSGSCTMWKGGSTVEFTRTIVGNGTGGSYPELAGSSQNCLRPTVQLSPPTTGEPTRIVAIQSKATGRYVSAEFDYAGCERYAMLRARQFGVGPYERFRLAGNCYSAEGCTIQALGTGLYVSAELMYTGDNFGMLRARRDGTTGVGSWERFQFSGDCAADVGCAIRSVGAAKYVTAEFGYATESDNYGMLRARNDAPNPVPGAWERFTIVSDCGNSAGCSMQSLANKKYVGAELDRTGATQNMLRARRDFNAGPWERFRLHGDCTSTFGCGIQFGGAHNTAGTWVPAQFVAVELDSNTYLANTYAMLRARSWSAGAWERFRLEGNCGDAAIGCAVRSVQNGSYVAAELDFATNNIGMLRARTSTANPCVGCWERFRFWS